MAGKAQKAARDPIEAGLEPSPVGRVIAAHRREQGWTLAEVSRRTGVSISALSKIENGHSRPAYDVMTRLAAGLDLDFAALFGTASPQSFSGAVRAITRAGEGKTFRTGMGAYEVLAGELAAKSLTPMVIAIPPSSPGRAPVRSAHDGEEFVYVLAGEVVFTMAPYSPAVLGTGDSVYFDGTCEHGFCSTGPGPARILSVVFAPRRG
ncbi:transcriptional regulator, XRE family with cupin sensor [Devosia enhydra]|uniref:Transcriptional regulator, XRE family with cupin sensor n=1 Tax=Devosia enhydra TaxID=665118 RepID=A0A1K2I0W8_9HYPH|nr:XRE family transcriptional regulator [Devosia enhydra]SFZ85428.1 transcriptional regulator, XRE family with cupin sensor [Devosia enhydra]